MDSTTAPSNDESEEYRFTETQDWFSGNIPLWTSFMPLVGTPNPQILEIGSWEGRSATFLLTSPLCANGGSITCIDHFDLFATPAGRERHKRVLHNLSLTGRPFKVIEKFSVPGLMTLLEEAAKGEITGFDWLYIDGSHRADDTFLDAELAWRLANEGAIFIFDDYLWYAQPHDSPHRPKPGIDAFMKLHKDEFEIISSSYQMVLRKKTKMHIGFLVESSKPVDIGADAFGHSVNIVLVVDASYAMPATVTIHSIAKHSSRRLTFYIIDCGLGVDHRDRMTLSIARKPNVSLVFIPLNGDGLGASLGPVWAKIDLVDLLPVERALYLDADILAREEIGRLWDTDLDGKLLGACPDVGFPLGHEKIERGPYFNAGVLLMDLTRIRGEVQELRDVAKSMLSSKFVEQDALNVHFRGGWKSLSLEWNAQGLGTYADLRTTDRQAAKLHEMADPMLVHFTGPVSPSLPLVLNPYIQPCVSKPWGYAKARGHPYAEEWWTALRETPWAEWVESKEYRAWYDHEKAKAKAQAIQEFDKVVEA
ncbi:glycosyltransferase family 8 protein [Thelephora ganbajun]|uniref:Glycosyltransferase family 8 protein n=1 Tax=Thelephora ganbajun TaxID=370292 RepID=A0ACB6ZRL4_THEGA|nr:glycosyltransferase family 8 protein [Thelephora ganbajun]